jgi:type II secretory pathway pseudopilin PulG
MEKTTMSTSNVREAGFSMVELLVAMVMTLMVSGAIFGLLTGGQNAFRREPEMTDRQQNIRIAMDLIKRDVAGAGAGMQPFVQAFTNGLNAAGGNPTNGGGQTLGVIDSPATATDILEVLTASGECTQATLSAPPGSATPGTLSSNDRLPSCFPDSAAANRFFYVGTTDVIERDAYGVVMGRASVLAGQRPFDINVVGSGTPNLNPTAGPSAGFCNQMAAANGIVPSCLVLMPVDVVRYQIAPDPDDPTLPALWRSRTGAFTATGGPGATPGGTANWEVVARGIEDMQIKYFRGGAWVDTPGNTFCDFPCNSPTTPAAADFNRIVRRVRVTLSARATGKSRIQGSTTAGGGARAAIRGQLMAEMTPRAALSALTTNNTTPGWY